MINKSFFDELSQQIARLLPVASALGDDVKKSISAALQNSFQKMDLVTREEFEAQTRALQRAQEKMDAMEVVIAELEQSLARQATQTQSNDPANDK